MSDLIFKTAARKIRKSLESQGGEGVKSVLINTKSIGYVYEDGTRKEMPIGTDLMVFKSKLENLNMGDFKYLRLGYLESGKVMILLIFTDKGVEKQLKYTL